MALLTSRGEAPKASGARRLESARRERERVPLRVAPKTSQPQIFVERVRILPLVTTWSPGMPAPQGFQVLFVGSRSERLQRIDFARLQTVPTAGTPGRAQRAALTSTVKEVVAQARPPTGRALRLLIVAAD